MSVLEIDVDGSPVAIRASAPVVLGLGGTVALEIEVVPPSVIVRQGGAVTPNPDILVIPAMGPEGPEGPQGPPGSGAGYDHTQASPSASWVVTHNLGYYPAVAVNIDSQLGICDVIYSSVNVVTIQHASPQTGSVHLI